MATTEQITALRVLLGAASAAYSDPELSALIDLNGDDLNVSAAKGWSAYAASTATMVNISESGSSRSMGDIHKNALTMAKHFQSLVDAVAPIVDSSRSRTRRIERV